MRREMDLQRHDDRHEREEAGYAEVVGTVFVDYSGGGI